MPPACSQLAPPWTWSAPCAWWPQHPSCPWAVRHRRCGESAYGHHARRTVRERSRLVEGHALDLGKPLQRIAFAHQHAEFGEVADGGHDGGRGSEHERAGAEHDKDGDRSNDFPGHQPRDRCRRECDDHNPRCPPVGQPHDLRFASVRASARVESCVPGSSLLLRSWRAS